MYLPKLNFRAWAVVMLLLTAQPNWAQAPRSAFRTASQAFTTAGGQLDYLAPLRALLTTPGQFDADAYDQALATYYSFVGQVPPSQAGGRRDTAIHYNLSELEPQLRVQAQKVAVVIINEAHNQPAHRVYCNRLLRELAPLGYRCFTVEALDPADTAINQRKFPVAASGFYTREPNMGNLLRAARAGGYQLFSHEVSAAQEKAFTDWRRRSNFRDSVQALNLLAVLRAHPGTKLVALVGYDHAIEKERDGLKRLATYLHELGQIDPLTIDQTSAYQPTDPVAPQPRLLTTAAGIPTTRGYNQGYVDWQVVHPPLAWVQDRPTWLATAPSAQLLTVAVPRACRGQRCLVQLYDRAEYRQQGTKAVPLDQYLVAAGQLQAHLYHPATSRRVVVRCLPANLPKP